MLKYARDIPDICSSYRKVLALTQKDVAEDTGYSIENVCAFEKGRNLNYIIFLWYLEKGLDIEFCRMWRIRKK